MLSQQQRDGNPTPFNPEISTPNDDAVKRFDFMPVI
jgi:hypothetical protein